MSLNSEIEPAANNIYRDITKCLTCYVFFTKEMHVYLKFGDSDEPNLSGVNKVDVS